MIEFLRPGFLVAGAASAAIPLLLHLLVRRPPRRAALPTFRFLRTDRRSTLRLRRRPSDLLLLALRMALLVLLGAALAQPRLVAGRAGVAEIVLLDRSAPAAAGWNAALDHGRDLLLDGDGTPRGALVLFDTAAVVLPAARVSAALFDSLAAEGSGEAGVDYAAALRALPAARRAAGDVDSARITLVSPLRWAGWGPGLAPLRRAAWPGRLELFEPSPPPPRELPAFPEHGTAHVRAEEQRGRFVMAALGAVGWEVDRSSPGLPLPQDRGLYVLPDGVRAADVATLRTALGDGATAILPAAEVGRFGVANGFHGAAERIAPAGSLVLVDHGPARLSSGTGPSVIAVHPDGATAATAERSGDGCVVALGFALEGGSLPLWDRYPRLVERLARGCEAGERPTPSGTPLDDGARAVLAGAAAGTVPIFPESDEGETSPLGRWLMLAVLALAGFETAAAYGRRRTG